MLQNKLKNSLQQMGISLSDHAQQQLLDYIVLLTKWNKVYNLTAVRDPEQMLTHHILDSLTVLPYLDNIKTVLDIGTGAGLPGIPLAIARPDIKFQLLDSQQKRINFLQHVITSLQLTNVVALHQRVELLQHDAAIDMVVSRAFASLNDFVNLIANICDDHTKIVAMKGRKAQALEEQQQLPPQFRVMQIDEVQVPDLNAERCLVVLQKQGD
jgi:16S rRNA (guanine527-N7)-methyltransferase